MSKINPFSNGKISFNLILFSSVITLIVIYALLTTYFWYHGAENIISWNVVSTLQESSAEVSFNTFDKILLTVNEPLFYIKEHYLPTGSIINSYAKFIYLIGLMAGTLLILSSTLPLRSMWFMIGIALLGIVLLSFRLEVSFGQLNKSPFLIAFFSLALIAYLYNSWIKKNALIYTLPVFALITFLLTCILNQWSKVPDPFLQITSYSVSIGFLLCCIFIFFISHELIGLILKVVSTNSLGGKSSLVQFCVASCIYILNAGLIYLENSNKISATDSIIGTWWLFLGSFTAGFWGFKAYCDQTEFISFKQSGRWFYAGGGLISLGTISYLYATDNNPLIELLADFISISHLVMGIVFFGYVLINFMQPMRQQLPVYRVLFKPPFIRLILIRLIAVFGILILFIFKNYYSLNQYLAGHYNALGDYSLATNDLFVAETYYKKSVAYDEFNHKGNYSLASLAQSQGDFTAAGFYFNQATKKQPTPFAYSGLSESLLQANLYFDAVNNLKKGLSVFPESSQLATNLSQQYSKASIIDSSYLYADIAYKNCGNCEVESTNLLAFWLENAKKDRLDSIYQQFYKATGISVLANKAAIQKKLSKPSEQKADNIKIDSVLSINQFAYIYNSGTNVTSTSKLNNIPIASLINIPENSGYFADLTFVNAKQNYFYGDKTVAFQQLSYLTRDEAESTKTYDLTLAGWYLNEGLYDTALNYFAKGGDTLSIQGLQLANYKLSIEKTQKLYAQEVNKSLTLENYQSVLQKSPYNPYVVDKIVNMLLDDKKLKRAYNVSFEAVQVNTESLLLWKTYTIVALKNGLVDYAAEGLSNIERLASPEAYQVFKSQYDDIIRSRENF